MAGSSRMQHGVSCLFKSVFLKGMVVRIMFCLHSSLCLFLVQGDALDYGRRGDWLFVLYGVFIALMLMDSFYSFQKSKVGKFCKVFSPTIALYITFIVPCVWLMELTKYDLRKVCTGSGMNNSSCNQKFEDTPVNWNDTGLVWNILESQPSGFSFLQYDFLLQTMMLILIIGRWLLPQGKLSRDQLLQLLLIHIGLAADSLEFLTDSLATQLMDRKGVILVLSFWSWSLPQFTLTLNLTKTKKSRASKSRKDPRASTGREDRRRSAEDGKDFYDWPELFFATELWSIFVTTVLMQDLPFLVVRVCLMVSAVPLVIENKTILYFSCKNILVILVQSYRMAAIVSENRKRRAAWQSCTVCNTDIDAESQATFKVSTRQDPKELTRIKPEAYELKWNVKALNYFLHAQKTLVSSHC